MNKKTLYQFSFIDIETHKVTPVSKFNTHSKLFRDSENKLLKPDNKEQKIENLLNET